METQIKIFARKSDHYNYSGDEKYNTYLEYLRAETEQGILDIFYKKNRRADASHYSEFVDNKWQLKYDSWLNSEDYNKRSFNLYYENSIVD